MASSWAPGLQERIQQKRLLSFINHSVDFVRSYIPFVSSPTSKVADVNMLPPWTAKDEMKHSEGVHEVVKEHSALSCWTYVATKSQTFDETEKGTDGEHMEQLLEALRSPPSASETPRHRQLYPPGRIMHMVALRISEEQGSQTEGVALYETPRDMYNKIRLDKSMIRDHYMPRYIETMEMLIDQLAENDVPPSDTNNVRLD
ncbi:uncharacterized protein [Triticum aestivum]|nr:uncharacterized protein LOC123074077 isoform X1 [Triticum aestivum]XP_044352956.1 uncharacterized protein LOC123074077 isoform X1 [Triticum aestivum]